MNRNLIHQLVAWKASNGRKPLILRGVRQTGKTYLLTKFGEEHFDNVYVINFEKSKQLRTLFEKDLDPQRIINDLRFELNAEINIDKDLVVFDEIQACPNALTSLKYFCEDLPELAVCSAGSLLGLHLNDTSYPVGKVDMMHLFPMTFSEFLSGIGDNMAAELIQNYKLGDSISETQHRILWDRFKQYFITGGLPEIVKLFRDSQNNLYQATSLVRTKQDELIKAYYADIAKHAGKINAMHIDRTWRAVPKQLAENYDVSTSRFRFKDIIPSINRYRQLVSVIDWLQSAELVIQIPIIGAFEQPMSAYTKGNLFKLMMFDVGILGAMTGIEPSLILKEDYGTYKGYFAENFVAQQLIMQNRNQMTSWQENHSEIEFLFQSHGDVIPIEVKSSTVTRAKSLRKYIDKYKPRISIILSANTPHMNRNKTVLHLPLYLAEKINQIVS